MIRTTDRLSCLLALGAAGMGLSCETQEPQGPPAFEVQQIEKTVVVTQDPDGTVTVTESDDLALVGEKRVTLGLSVLREFELRNVILTYWLAGANAGADSIEIAVNETFAASSFHGFPRDVPDSEDLGLCEGLYYSWTFAYTDPEGRPGTFFGQPRVIMPSKRFVNGQLEQALCEEPPGPGE